MDRPVLENEKIDEHVHQHLCKRREKWYTKRKILEGSSIANATPGRRKSIKSWRLFSYLINFFNFFLKFFFLFNRGKRNSLHCQVKLQDHMFPNIPDNFNGLTILQISDLHLQEDPTLIDRIIYLVSGLSVDIVAFTGDFTTKSVGNLTDEELVGRLEKLINAIRPKIGPFGVLGNHDHAELVNRLEGIGIKMLVNEAVD